MRLVLLLVLGTLLARPPAAQLTADSSDVASIDAILGALYDVISGPADRERDWDRFRSLFHPDGVLAPTSPTEAGGRAPSVITPDEFAARSADAMRNAPIFQGKGFYETESARRIERYGSIAHAWSTYESRLDPAEAPFMRGVNSIQLVHDGTRWWVLSVFWEHETPDTPLPDAYLVD